MNKFNPLMIKNLHDYKKWLTDKKFWQPTLQNIADKKHIKIESIESGKPGTFPTFIINHQYTIKLFGDLFFGPSCFLAENDVYRIFKKEKVGLVPNQRTKGYLFEDAQTWRWPYIMFDYIQGDPYAKIQRQLTLENKQQLAKKLATLIKKVHRLYVPHGKYLKPGWTTYTFFLNDQFDKVVSNHKKWHALPAKLIKQIPDYIGDLNQWLNTSQAPNLLHADLHQDHILGQFKGKSWQLKGIIDWGDARVGDSYYELPALHLGTFQGNKKLLAAFLNSYRWPEYQSDFFVKKAMVTTLLHEFDVLEKLARTKKLHHFKTLDALANTLWKVN